MKRKTYIIIFFMYSISVLADVNIESHGANNSIVFGLKGEWQNAEYTKDGVYNAKEYYRENNDISVTVVKLLNEKNLSSGFISLKKEILNNLCANRPKESILKINETEQNYLLACDKGVDDQKGKLLLVRGVKKELDHFYIIYKYSINNIDLNNINVDLYKFKSLYRQMKLIKPCETKCNKITLSILDIDKIEELEEVGTDDRYIPSYKYYFPTDEQIINLKKDEEEVSVKNNENEKNDIPAEVPTLKYLEN